MAETMSFALVGALILTLTLDSGARLLLVQEAESREHRNRAFEWMKEKYAIQLDWALARPKADSGDRHPDLRGHVVAGSFHRR